MARGKGQGHGSGTFSGYTCVKYIFFIFNVLFWLMGCALLGVGIWLHVSKGTYASLTSAEYFSVTAVCMAAGCFMIVVSFFGCCGAVMENQCMLIFYFVLVILIFILEVSFGIIAFVYRNDIGKELRKELSKGLEQKYGNEEGMTEAWDEIQQQFKCCGVHNETDWYRISEWPNHDYTPDSCCEFEAKNCGRDPNPEVLKFRKGCYDEVKYKVTENLYILGVIGLTIGILQILGLVAAMALFCYLRSEKYEDYYET